MAHMRAKCLLLAKWSASPAYYQFGQAVRQAGREISGVSRHRLATHTYRRNTYRRPCILALLMPALARVALSLSVWQVASRRCPYLPHEYFTCNHIVFPLTFKIVLACGGNGRGRGIAGRFGHCCCHRCHT